MSKDYAKVNIVVAKTDGTTTCVYCGSANTLDAMAVITSWTQKVQADEAKPNHFIKVESVRMLPYDMFELNYGDILDEMGHKIGNTLEKENVNE